jgi:hypothetical protein
VLEDAGAVEPVVAPGAEAVVEFVAEGGAVLAEAAPFVEVFDAALEPEAGAPDPAAAPVAVVVPLADPLIELINVLTA